REAVRGQEERGRAAPGRLHPRLREEGGEEEGRLVPQGIDAGDDRAVGEAIFVGDGLDRGGGREAEDARVEGPGGGGGIGAVGRVADLGARGARREGDRLASRVVARGRGENRRGDEGRVDAGGREVADDVDDDLHPARSEAGEAGNPAVRPQDE